MIWIDDGKVEWIEWVNKDMIEWMTLIDNNNNNNVYIWYTQQKMVHNKMWGRKKY